jgi:hypothetical protein
MEPKPGASVFAWRSNEKSSTDYQAGRTPPYILGWRYGKGYTWSLSDAAMQGIFFKEGIYDDRHTYVYGHDAFFGLLLYATGRNLPENVIMVHNLRENFGEYSDATTYVISMIDFVEKFEVNINPLLIRADELQDKWNEGRYLYLAQEWEESKIIMEGLVEDVRIFTEETLAFKDRALLWVYVTEWAVVTATSIITGFILWTLMISRRFYRKIDQTRLRPPPGEVGSDPTVYRDDNRPWWRKGKLSRLFTIRLQELIH